MVKEERVEQLSDGVDLLQVLEEVAGEVAARGLHVSLEGLRRAMSGKRHDVVGRVASPV